MLRAFWPDQHSNTGLPKGINFGQAYLLDSPREDGICKENRFEVIIMSVDVSSKGMFLHLDKGHVKKLRPDPQANYEVSFGS